jgi:hypothetical protein
VWLVVMKSLVRPKSLVVVAMIVLGVSGACLPTRGEAQENKRTPLSRATELVDAYIEQAQHERDPALKRRMLIEGYAALLSLPIDRDVGEVALKLRKIDDWEKLTDADSQLMQDAIATTKELAKKYQGRDRVAQLNRILFGDYAAEIAIRTYEFKRLADANAREAMAEFLAAEPDEVRYRRIEELCRLGKIDLAGQAALAWTDRKWANFTGGILSELGMVREAEARALENMTPGGLALPRGVEMLTTLAITESRRGNVDTVQRIARMVLDSPYGRQAASEGYIGHDLGPCESKLWNEWPDWRHRSIGHSSSAELRDEPGPPDAARSILSYLGEAVAGAGVDPRSAALIDELIAVQDREYATKGVDPLNVQLLGYSRPQGMSQEEHLSLFSKNVYQRNLHVASRKALTLARFAAGGGLDDASAAALRPSAVQRTFWNYPHSRTAERILALSDAEQKQLGHVAPGIDLVLRFNSLVRAGRGLEARALLAGHPNVHLQFRGDRPLLRMVGVLENAGLRSEAVAMLDAYLQVEPEPDTLAVHFLLTQGRADQAKAMLLDMVDTGSNVFVGAMLLRELDPTIDVGRLQSSILRGEPYEQISNWMKLLDALAWHAASREIETLLRNPPAALLLLEKSQAACARDTITGLHSVALARRGELEAALRMVVRRDLKQRCYCVERWRDGAPDFEYGEFPHFDARYLVQEWVSRGHAAN